MSTVARDSIWWRLGDGFVPSPLKEWLYKSLIKTDLIDINGWSLIHLMVGFIASYAFGMGFWTFFVLHAIWEFYQIVIGMSDIYNLPITEWIDILFDTLFALVGWTFGSKAVIS